MQNPETKNEKWWFGLVADDIKEAEFGSITFKLTVKNSKVVNIKRTVEKNINICVDD